VREAPQKTKNSTKEEMIVRDKEGALL